MKIIMIAPSWINATALKALAVWLLIVPIAFLNGLFREAILLPFLGPGIALPASGALLAFFIFCLTWRAIPHFELLNDWQYGYIGAGWLGLSILFESGLGFAIGKLPAELLQEYDVRTGNLWCVVLFVIAISPWIVAKLRNRL